MSAKLPSGGKAGFIGHIIADEDRPCAAHRWLRHQAVDRPTLIAACRAHFDHHLAGLQVEIEIRGDGFGDGAGFAFDAGIRPVMERYPKAFLFKKHVRATIGKLPDASRRLVKRPGPVWSNQGSSAPVLTSVASRNGQFGGSFTKYSVDLLQRATTDDGHPVIQRRQGFAKEINQFDVRPNLVGPIDKVQQCTIQIEEQACTFKQVVWRK